MGRRKFLDAAGVFLVAGLTISAHAGTANNTVKMPHYSVVIPSDQGWHLKTEGGSVEKAVATMKPGKGVIVEMQFMRNGILSDSLRALSAADLAADFMSLERRVMEEEGVGKGAYTLSDVKIREETHGEKTYRVMQYQTETKSSLQHAWLCLYIPKETGNEAFIIAHYSVTAPQKSPPANDSHDQFAQVLASLQAW